ncbi:MTRF1L release factor glutamine methyltransferase [Culicoides brevitarsis]|uniref:MTRF1L release factor glutamine methyltransferase n=1 Tax=Culicoides brevitarsis TaxID=469753 RepID=UPI00307BBFE7
MLQSLNFFKKIQKKSQIFKFSTVAEELSRWTKKLSAEKIAEPESSMRNLMAHVLKTQNLGEVDAKMDQKMTESEISQLESLVYARLAHMPVQYIIKEWDFRQLKGLKIIPPVFIPRPETEELVSYISEDLKQQKMQKFKFLEVGSGSGVISISLLREFPSAKGFCFDVNELAVGLTRYNAEKFGVQARLTVEKFKLTDENVPFTEQEYDLIVSNPPYVFTRELQRLEDDVKLYEDMRALDGGGDGLNVVNNILKVAEKYLRKDGSLWLETHFRHPVMLRERFKGKTDGLAYEKTVNDLFGKERFVKFVKK